MKVIQLLVLIFIFSLTVISQVNEKSVLSGTVYDAYGAVIQKANVTATNEKGEKFETKTNNDGIYILDLPFKSYNSSSDFRIAKYEISATFNGFETFVLKDFKFIPSYKGTMNLDIALDVQASSDRINIQTK